MSMLSLGCYSLCPWKNYIWSVHLGNNIVLEGRREQEKTRIWCSNGIPQSMLETTDSNCLTPNPVASKSLDSPSFSPFWPCLHTREKYLIRGMPKPIKGMVVN